jgi:hypothetical protein
MGEAKLTALIQESLPVATQTEAMRPKDLARVIVDTTVQPKPVMFPIDAKLLNRAQVRLVRLAAHVGVELRLSYARVGKLALICPAILMTSHLGDGHSRYGDMIGNTIERVLADAGYRGHNAPADYKFRVCTSGQKRRLTP